MNTNEFKFYLPVLKAANRKYTFFGRASSVATDKQGDAFSTSAIAAMQKALPVPLVVGDTHQGTLINPSAIIGEANPTDHRNPTELIVRCDLIPDDVRTPSLWWVLKNSPSELSLSVAGQVPVNARQGYRGNYQITDVKLDSIMLCRSASAVQQEAGVWIDEIAKAAFGEEIAQGMDIKHLLRNLSEERNVQLGKVADDVEDVSDFLKNHLRVRG